MTPVPSTAPDSSRKPRRLRWQHAGYASATLVVLAIAVCTALIWYASTPRFSARVHRTLVATLERATGGKVEIRSFRWSVRHLAIEVDGLTIHGKESPDQVPYFHVDHLTLHAKIVSFLTPKISLASMVAEKPVFHLIVYPDGTTNQPQAHIASKEQFPQTLLKLAIDSTRVQNGLVLLNNRAVPWEMASGPLQLTMRYVSARAGYQAEFETRNITFRLKNATEAHSQLKARVSLTEDAVGIEDLDLKTGRSRLAMTAQFRNFSHPSWRMEIHGSADAREIGAITGENELRNGVAQLNIQAHGGPGGEGTREIFQVAGHVDLRSAEWESSWLRLRNVELHTNLIVDNDQCSLTGFSSVLDDGGKISGSLVMKHCVGPSKPVVSPAVWQSAAPEAGRSTSRSWVSRHPKLHMRELLERLHRKHKEAKMAGPAYQPLDAEMEARVSGVTLPLILAATAPKEYWNIGFTTATSGEVTAHWTGDGHGLDVHGNLTMDAPKQLMGLIPVKGSAHADYLGDHHHLVIEQVDETTPGTQVHGAGTLTLFTNDKNSNLHLDVVGHDLGEFDQLLTTLDLRATPRGQPHALPVKLLGPMTFHGDIHGSFFALEAVGHMDSQRFEMVVARAAPPGDSNAVAPPVHLLTWDQFHGDLSYAPSRLIVRNAELVRGNAVIHTAMDLLPNHKAPDDYTYDKRTHITAMVQTNDASIADLQSVLGASYPASGELTAEAHVAGIVDDLEGSGHIALAHAVIQGQEISSATVQMVAHGHIVDATRLQFAATGGTASGELLYDYETGALQGELTGQHFALEQVAVLKTRRLPVGGTLGFHVQTAGTTEFPVATGSMQIENLTLNRQPMGRLHAEANLQRGILLLTSRADLLKTHLDMAGQVQLSGNYPAQAHLTFADFNIDPLLHMMASSGIYGTSSIEGRITMSGPLKQLSAVQADVDLKAFHATIDRRPIHSAGPVEVSLRNGKLQLKQAHLQGEDVDFLAEGTVDVLDNYRLRLHSEGSIDAGFVEALYPNIRSSGKVQFVVNARGTARQPDLRGRAQVSHVNVHMLNVTNGLTDMNGEMLFDQDRLVVHQLKGSSGGGELQINGFVGYRSGIFVDLTTTTKDVRIRYPKGVSSSADAKLRLLGSFDNLLLSGNIKMMRFGIGSSVDLASLAGSGTGISAPIDPSSPLNRVRLDIHVTSAPELGFQNSFASLAGDVNLRIRGTLENPSVLGRIDILQGSASFAGTKYRLQQGDIVFANPVTISPQINLEAAARVQNYDIIITLHGPPSKLDISYRSEPPLTQADVLALLALGRTNEQATMYGEQQQAGANLTTEALLGGALNAAVSSRVQKLFGVGSVRVDPNFVGTLGESTARVTVEEQVGRSLTLTFATNVNTTAQQLFQAQYDLSRTVSVIAVRDEANVFSMYLQIRAKHK